MLKYRGNLNRNEMEKEDFITINNALDFSEYFSNTFEYYDCNANGRVYKFIDLSKRGQSAMTMIEIFNYWIINKD